jgi:hypothetical protein
VFIYDCRYIELIREGAFEWNLAPHWQRKLALESAYVALQGSSQQVRPPFIVTCCAVREVFLELVITTRIFFLSLPHLPLVDPLCPQFTRFLWNAHSVQVGAAVSVGSVLPMAVALALGRAASQVLGFSEKTIQEEQVSMLAADLTKRTWDLHDSVFKSILGDGGSAS